MYNENSHETNKDTPEIIIKESLDKIREKVTEALDQHSLYFGYKKGELDEANKHVDDGSEELWEFYKKKAKEADDKLVSSLKYIHKHLIRYSDYLVYIENKVKTNSDKQKFEETKKIIERCIERIEGAQRRTYAENRHTLISLVEMDLYEMLSS